MVTDNVTIKDEKIFQLLTDIYQYLLQEFTFKTKNQIILSFFVDKKIYENIGLSIDKKYLLLQNNRNYNEKDLKIANKHQQNLPLLPIKKLFLMAHIVKIEKINHKITIKKDKKLTNKFYAYLDKHMFNNNFIENEIEDEYNNYYNIKNNIFLCCATNDLKCVKQYVKYGLNINIQDKDGRTPLTVATFRNKFDIVKYLLKNGANPNIYPKNYENAYLLAKRKNYIKIADLLEPVTILKSRYKTNKNNDYKNMCLGGSGKYKTFCYNINNADLKNSCIAFAEHKNTCYNIQDNDIKNLCLSKIKNSNFCYNINDINLKNMCLGVTQGSSYCYNIEDENIKNMCLGISKSSHYCYDIH